MTSNLFSRVRIEECVLILPNELDNMLDNHIMEKLRAKFVGKCSHHGYVKSIDKLIQKEDNPLVDCLTGVGECNINVSVLMNRCLPVIGSLLETTINTDDELMGAYVAFEEGCFFSILNDDKSVKLSVGDKVIIRVEDFQIKNAELFVNIVGKFHSFPISKP